MSPSHLRSEGDCNASTPPIPALARGWNAPSSGLSWFRRGRKDRNLIANGTSDGTADATLVKNKRGFLTREFFIAHDLCFAVHDILTQFLVSGEQSGVFKSRIHFNDKAEAAAFEEAEDIFEWFETTGRLQDRLRTPKALVLPAVLSDMLHCLHEARECSRKGKLNVTYALIRKLLQENLFVLESIVLDEADFDES